MKEDYEYMQTSLTLTGDGFDPNVLKDLYNPMELTIVHTTGEIMKNGRYKGKPSPYGMCYFIVPKTISHEYKISLITTLYHRISQLNCDKNLHIDNFEIELIFSGVQGNMSLTTEELSDLANTKSTILMNYIYIKGDKPPKNV